MTLTVGSGPFGHDPAGEFNVEIEIDGEVEPPVRTPWSDPDWRKA